MRKLAIGGSLAVLALAGCTTSGVGTGQSAVGNVGATFTYTQTGATRGTMVASLTNAAVGLAPETADQPVGSPRRPATAQAN